MRDALAHLNGPQTTGRSFRQLSQPRHRVTEELDVPIEVRDGTRLMADVFRPSSQGRFPALVAFSPYPRQMQQSGLPAGLVEAGSTAFWVSRGYGHVIVNARGTGGSQGTYTLMDGQERIDLHDAIEWTAAQDWCDGRVGMIGVSYFGMAQLMAAAEAPPSLRALFPFAAASGLRQATHHGGMLSDLFFGGWLGAVGMLAPARRAASFRSAPARAIERLLNADPVHRRFEKFDGEAALASLTKLMRLSYPAQPWADLYQQATVENPTGEEDFWRERDWAPLLGHSPLPLHLGCAWDNVALHLSGAFTAWEAIAGRPGNRLSLLGPGGLSWPWESMHVEALAWYDHWLKDRDTGALEGPPIRYWLRGAEEYRTLEAWPPPGATDRDLHLRADGSLGASADRGGRDYLFAPPALKRPANQPSPSLPPALTWDSEPAGEAFDVVGACHLDLEATSTAAGVDWIAKLSLVDEGGAVTDLTQGWLRARDPERSRIPFVPTAVRVQRGERLRLTLTSNDRGKGMAMSGFSHLPLATPSRQHVRASSRLLLPALQ
ncbi:MAG TPA: CocE/NonD family hydrolase [Solirubrobacterales bacterium]|nr:CocE/NonD family hydrolase [Solirubrobacterales bacterium]